MLAQFYMCAIYSRHFTLFTFVVTGDWKPGKKEWQPGEAIFVIWKSIDDSDDYRIEFDSRWMPLSKSKSMEARSQAGTCDYERGENLRPTC